MSFLQSLHSVTAYLADSHALWKIGHSNSYEPVTALAWLNMVVLTCALIAVNFAHGGELRCPGRNVAIHSVDRDDAQAACEAAGEAIDFLAAHGLDTTGPVEMHLVNKLPDIANESAAGCYDRAGQRAYMLAFSDCLTKGPWFGLPLNRALYKSFLTHEIAHVLVAANFSIPKPSVLAQEYLAYVTMLATMPPRQRERVLKRFPGQGFDSVDKISLIFLMMDPSRFGVEAYRHFLKPGNGEAFLKEVLSGRVLIDEGAP